MARKTITTRSSAADNVRPGQVVGEEQIRRRAYEVYQKRQGDAGDAAGDWYRAEAELREGAGHRQDAGHRKIDAVRPISATLD